MSNGASNGEFDYETFFDHLRGLSLSELYGFRRYIVGQIRPEWHMRDGKRSREYLRTVLETLDDYMSEVL